MTSLQERIKTQMPLVKVLNCWQSIFAFKFIRWISYLHEPRQGKKKFSYISIVIIIWCDFWLEVNNWVLWYTVCSEWFSPSTFLTPTIYIFLKHSWHKKSCGVFSFIQKRSFQYHYCQWPLFQPNSSYFNSVFTFFKKFIIGSYVFG